VERWLDGATSSPNERVNQEGPPQGAARRSLSNAETLENFAQASQRPTGPLKGLVGRITTVG
jgi:hypothetical protein